jgi:hypothetical protein
MHGLFLSWNAFNLFDPTCGPVLPTNSKNFLLDQPKYSAAGEKVRPPHKIDSQRPILQFFNGLYGKEK